MKAGMIFSFQMAASSLRQLSIESLPADAAPAHGGKQSCFQSGF
jgi:hypothetical protein